MKTKQCTVFFISMILLGACSASSPSAIPVGSDEPLGTPDALLATPRQTAEMASGGKVEPASTRTLASSSTPVPSHTPAPTSTQIPLDLSSLELRGLDLSIVPPVDQLKTVNGCYMLFMDAECIGLLDNTLLQGTAAKNKVASLVSDGVLEPAYGASLDQIAQDYRVFTLNRLYLREGYAAFAHVPGEDAAISPAALAPLGDDYYKVVFLLPRDASVYVFGMYVVESGEIVGLYNVSTGI